MLKSFNCKPIYRSHVDDFDIDFMIPLYFRSVKFDRASGYFTVSSLIQSIDGIIGFIKNNGCIRLICSPELSNDDISFIKLGNSLSEEHITRAILDKLNLEGDYTDEDLLKLDIICNMISSGKLLLRIAFMPNGIYHEKFGIFTDLEDNKVHYIGSANETLSAKISNIESFTVQTSWDNDRDRNLISSQEEYFQNLWNDQIEGVSVIPFPEAVEHNLFELYKRSSSIEAAIDAYYLSKTTKSNKRELYPYQEKAIQEFVDNGYSHFYEMATGTGKTFTSIRTIKKVLQKVDPEPVITVICVPQIELQTQWAEALHQDGYMDVFLLGGVSSNTMGEWTNALFLYKLKKKSVICVAIYDTFFDKIFDKCLLIDNLFFIVDEAHNISPSQFSKLPNTSKYRLGLSATIQRYNKIETQKIIEYFTGGNIPPYYYGIEDAIKNGFLSHYKYYPIFVELTELEFEKYQKKTLAISYALNAEPIDMENISTLCQQRSLIVKQAKNKKDKLCEMVVSPDFTFKNAVVYCGQGKEDGEPIILSVTKIIHEAGYTVSHFTSKTVDRPRVLYEFATGYYDSLVAIKCFDEGVDVPQLDKIYIMSSDTSMRQTVQRRGRVLRVCKDTNKDMAYIYDMLVLPPCSVERSIGVGALIANEISRAKEYARVADNANDVNLILDTIITEYNITEEDFKNERELH